MLISGLLLSTVAYAQNTVILRGFIKDYANMQILSNVTVYLHKAGKEPQMRMAISGKSGDFEFKQLPKERYRLVLTHLGYKTKTIEIPVIASPGVNLGVIKMTPLKTPLKEVNVHVQSPLIQLDIDKITYNLDADPESRTSSVMEILRKAPSIILHGDDEIQLNGNANFVVLINGKTSSLFIQSPGDVFKSMPASMVKSIELITTPPARYEAEGIAGVINIITLKKSLSGYNGTVNLAASNPAGFTIGSHLTGQTGKVGFSANLGNNSASSPTHSSDFFREDKVRLNRLSQNSETRSKNVFRYLGGEINYQMDSMSLLTLSFNLNTGQGRNDFIQQVELLGVEGDLTESYRQLNSGSNQWFGQDLGLEYKYNLKNKTEHFMTLSYKLSNHDAGAATDFSLQPLVNYLSKVCHADNDDGSTEHTFKADYVQPVRKHTLEIGSQAVIRLNNNHYTYSNLDQESSRFLPDPDLSNSFHYKQAIYAAYASFNLRHKKWGLHLGARLEKTLDAH
jgi:outer membrane receptor for ferrienterochelin and colicin